MGILDITKIPFEKIVVEITETGNSKGKTCFYSFLFTKYYLNPKSVYLILKIVPVLEPKTNKGKENQMGMTA